MPALRIATRRSPLALRQAEEVAAALRARDPELETALVPMRTTGDRLLDAPLAKVGGKGLFVKELERALLDGRADVAVHSMKDLPVALPDGLHVPVVTARADPCDALVAPVHGTLDALPAGARVGTSSLRRRCQVAALRPDLRLVELRGGVNTRLERLAEGRFEALVLACAGLDRLGLGARITERFDPARVVPAIGQGALGIECRIGDTRVETLLAPLADPDTAACVAAERAMNRRLEGGCQVPIAGFATHAGGRLHLVGLVASLDGREVLREAAQGAVDDADALGREVAEALLGRGAGALLARAYAEAGGG